MYLYEITTDESRSDLPTILYIFAGSIDAAKYEFEYQFGQFSAYEVNLVRELPAQDRVLIPYMEVR